MRTVIEGRPNRYHRLRARDLPNDFDLRQSYWKYVDFSGFDLSAYDMRDMDILDCDGSGSTLPGNLTDWMMSRRTDWTGAIIPADVSSYNHDLMVEVTRQAKPSLSGDPLAMAEAIDESISRGYGNSWQNNIHYVITKLGVTVPVGLPWAVEVFQGYPRLLSRLDFHTSRNIVRPEGPGDNIGSDFEFLVKHASTNERRSFQWALTDDDRYLTAQRIQNTVWPGKTGNYIAYVGQIDPWPWLTIVEEHRVVPDFGWWAASWPA
jgi:hypothetical protein